MLQITKNVSDSALTLALEGRLDTTTAPQLEGAVKESLDGVTSLTMDFAKLEYVSSAGLRVLLASQKQMNTQGEMVIVNACDDIREVFDITGFSDILTIK